MSYTIQNTASDGRTVTYWDSATPAWRRRPTDAYLSREHAEAVLAEIEAERPNRAGTRAVVPWPTGRAES